MAKFVKFPIKPSYSAPAPEATSTEGQMLKYLREKYGDKEADQFEIMNELNTHQFDNVVLSEKSVRPLSQLYGFFLPDWVKAGFAERVAAKALAGPAQPGKFARMEAHIRDLEAKLTAANVPFQPFVFDPPKAKAEPEKAAA